MGDEEREDRPKQEVVGLHEVAGPRFVRMIPNERRPALAPRGFRRSRTAHVLMNGSLPDAKLELEQFATDPHGTPQHVLNGHCLDERDGVWPDRAEGVLRSTTSLPAPTQAEALTVPAQQ